MAVALHMWRTAGSLQSVVWDGGIKHGAMRAEQCGAVLPTHTPPACCPACRTCLPPASTSALAGRRDIKPENVMFAEPPAEAKAAPLTAAQLQAGRPARDASAGQKMPTVKLVDLGMACLYDPSKPITGEVREGRTGRSCVPLRVLLPGANEERPPAWLADCLASPAAAPGCSPPPGPLGSPGFVAPEIIAGAPHSPAMDVFSLGVLLFIMLVCL